MMQEGSRLVKPTTLDDRMRHLLTTVPWPSSPTWLQLFLPRSIPRTAICIWLPPPFRIGTTITPPAEGAGHIKCAFPGAGDLTSPPGPALRTDSDGSR